MLKATTALKKIARLKHRVKVIQGSQGASKTFSILTLLINHASSNTNKEIIIASSELTKMRLTVIKDFIKIMKMAGIYEQSNMLAGTFYRFPNGSFIKFIGLDKEDVGKGLRSDVVYINEANKCKYEPCRELITRAGQIFIDFNPNHEFWAHEYYVKPNKCDFIILTFRDNELLPDTERQEILDYKERGFDKDGNVISEYWANKWRVYGLGEIGIVEGAIYTNWRRGTFPDTDQFIWGIDWGYRDPFTLTKFHIDREERKIYIKNYCYKSGLNPDQMFSVIEKHVNKDELLIYDSAGAQNGYWLIDKGYNAYPCGNKKNKAEAIGYVQNFELIVCDSPDVENELINYIWADRKAELPIDGHDHSLDALLYVARWHKINF